MRSGGLTFGLTLCAASAIAAPPPWLEVKSPHFTVVTNASEKTGRRMAWEFEQIRGVLVHLWPWARLDSAQRFAIFAVRDEKTLKTLGPQYWEGKQYRPVAFSAGGRFGDFVALRTDVRSADTIGSNPYQTAYWGYVASVLNASFSRRLPAWYSRGISEVMSNTIVRDEEIELGRVIRENLEHLRSRAPVPLTEFLGAEKRSRWLTDESDARLFDAQAWAFAHYLLFGEKGAHRAKLNRFTQLLRDATPPEVALREAFGDPAPYYDGMREYVKRSLFAYVKMPLSLDSRPEGYAGRALSEAEAAVIRGEFLAAMKRPVEARAFAAAADPSLPGPWEIEADLLEQEGARDRAKAAYLKAAEAGSRSAHVYYRLSQLESSTGRDKAVLERVSGWLEKARELEPGNADVLSFLAKVRDSLGQNAEALPLARKAVELEPDASYHRLVLANALWNARERDAAIQMGRTALNAADDDEERRWAQEFLDFANKH